MLVLSRRVDESVMVGDDVEIVVVEIRRDKVRLGVKAPQSTPVHRGEIYDAIKREGRRFTPTMSEQETCPTSPTQSTDLPPSCSTPRTSTGATGG